MSKIIITLNKNDISNLLLGGEVSITPSVKMLSNLQGIVIKHDEYNDYCTVEEDFDD